MLALAGQDARVSGENIHFAQKLSYKHSHNINLNRL